MAGLQDLLLLRELQDQANPVRSAFQSLAQGVSQGIAQAQEEQKQKRLEEETFAKNLNRLDYVKKKFGKDYDVSLSDNSIKLSSKPETTIPSGMKLKSFNSEGKATYEPVVPGLEDLPYDKQTQAMALARKMYGTRRSNEILPSIIGQLHEGKSIDEIEDSWRFSGQSPALSGEIRDAAQSVLLTSPIKQTEQALDFIDDELSKGNIDGVRDQLRKLSRDTAGAEQSRRILGIERTLEFINEIQNDLITLENNGIDTNIFSGTAEEIFKKVGTVNNPQLRAVATKIATSMMNYRRSMTGVAFSVPETAEYKSVWPSIDKTSAFNMATINALKSAFSGDLDNFYANSMGRDNYKKLFKTNIQNSTPVSTPMSSEQNNQDGSFSFLWER